MPTPVSIVEGGHPLKSSQIALDTVNKPSFMSTILARERERERERERGRMANWFQSFLIFKAQSAFFLDRNETETKQKPLSLKGGKYSVKNVKKVT